MGKLIIFICAVLLCFTQDGQCARILASIFSPSFSHQLAFRPIWQELAKRGHDLTVITTDPVKDAPYKQIDTSHSYKMMEELGMSNAVSNRNQSARDAGKNYIDGLHKISDYQFGMPEVQALINNKKEHFDLLMIEVIFPGQMAFVDRFKAPFIGLVSLDAPPVIHRAVGNPTHPILYPDTVLPFNNDLNFKQRLISFAANIGFYVFSEYFFYPKEDLNVKKHFGEFPIRPLSEIQYDMDLLFINVNPFFHKLRPLGPNTIQIGGGTHLQKAKALPQDLQSFLDKSKNGVIYFSLGTNVKTSLISDELKATIIETLGELPYDVLWKYEDEMKGLPKNIKISKWIPQQDVFKHPKIKLFITQCGLQSIEEAISNHIPLLGMPFFGDQSKNAQVVLEKGLGLVVDKSILTKEEFKSKILETIKDPKYKNKVKEIAELMVDVQMTGLQKAVWWTEYAIRNKGAKHLRSSGVQDPFYIYFMLDVIGFVLLIVSIITYINYRITKFVYRLIFKRNKQKRD